VALPDWIEPLLDADEMRRVDSWAISEQGVPGDELMERAGTALAEAVLRLAPGGRVVAVCGKGNNGGDGLVAVRRLRERGVEAVALLLGDPGELSELAKLNLDRLDGKADAFEPARLGGAAIVIDAIFGTGFSDEPRGSAAEAIESINANDAPVVAADIPSGVDASTGTAAELSVRAVATVTFHSAKVGHWIAPGKELRGELTVAGIGIPEGGPADPACGVIREAVLDLPPRRGAATDKFSAGSVGVFGGSRGLTGAPTMAARAASRAGAGYVTCAVPESLGPIFEVNLIEQMTIACPDEGGSMGEGAAERAKRGLGRNDCVIAGPGLGAVEAAEAECRALVGVLDCPVVVDAQGLGALAGHLGDVVAGRSAPTILTPHNGEAGRLLERDRAEIGAHRLRSARELAERTGAIVVLKGDDTIVTDGDRVALSPGDAPALATAGSGDVLSGVIGALVARGLEPFDAACAGVLAHVRAGRMAARSIGSPAGVVAGDLIDELPRALARGGG
jgi:NAD(P)H-hydrate epimerase